MKRLIISLQFLFLFISVFPQCASQTVIPNSAFDGKVAASNGSCVTYHLNKPLVAGVAYTFTTYVSGLIACGSPCSCYAQCQIWFGMSACDQTGQEKMINGGSPIPDGLNNYTFTITPYGNFTYISFVNYFNPAWSPACSGQFTIDSFSVSSPATPLAVNIQLNNNSCTIDSNGKATVHAIGDSPFTYQWSNGQTDSVLKNAPAGTYDVRVRDSTGCLTYDTVVIGTQTPSTPTITLFPNDTLKSSIASSYQWYWNGSAISGATNQYYIPQHNGSYDVVIVDSTGCTSNPSNYIPIVNISGITEINTANIRLYPNPATSILTIYSDNAIMNLKLCDLTGREIISKELNGSINNLDVSQISKGLYLIKIRQGEKIFCQKIVIK